MKRIIKILALLISFPLIFSSCDVCNDDDISSSADNQAAVSEEAERLAEAAEKEKAITEESVFTEAEKTEISETTPEVSMTVSETEEAETAEQTDTPEITEKSEETVFPPEADFDINDVPEYSGSAYSEVNGNRPFYDAFTNSEFEKYSSLDSQGRCGTAFACIGSEMLPEEERQGIGMIKPSGWHTVKYPDLIPDLYLYNRCHLIAFQLSGQNAEERNLITGTRYMNVEGMLPFENKTASYIRSTGNHVLYRVTPVFEADELVARGVLMEALSAEDNGAGLSFCVFCYNVQPGIGINYSDGESWTEEVPEPEPEPEERFIGQEYILNTNTKKFHYPDCGSVSQMKDKNKKEFTGSRDDIINSGYSPCKNCNP